MSVFHDRLHTDIRSGCKVNANVFRNTTAARKGMIQFVYLYNTCLPQQTQTRTAMNCTEPNTLLEKIRAFHASGTTRDLSFRKEYLQRLHTAVKARTHEIEHALYEDLRKSPEEAYISEISTVLAEIDDQLRHLHKRARIRRVRTPLFMFPSRSRIICEPKGTVLIMAPWNYPFLLALDPLVGAIAAGNCVVLKPSRTSAATCRLIKTLIAEVFPPDYVSVFDGNHDETEALLEQRFDHIFFTGGASFGRTVMLHAAKHLTPVTLELGGKSPCIVDKTADIDLAARKIAWGKLLNAGQTCIAPDYLLVHRSLTTALVDKIGEYVKRFYGDNLRQSTSYPRIINDKAFSRLQGYIDHGSTILYGGEYDASDRFIAPTILRPDSEQSPIMQEEIFGPILPLIEFDSLDDAADFVNAREKPLAFYYFGRRSDGMQLLRRTSSGGACINDTIMHIANPSLPFGGTGNSGMGRYHGRYSFETFSNMRSTVISPRHADIPLRYPPYHKTFGLLKKLL